MKLEVDRADLAFAWPPPRWRDGGAGGRQPDLPQGARHRRDTDAKRAELIEEYTQRFANPYIAAERGYVDT